MRTDCATKTRRRSGLSACRGSVWDVECGARAGSWRAVAGLLNRVGPMKRVCSRTPSLEPEMTAAKKAKLKPDSGRSFQQAWTESFGVIERNGKALCILCSESVVCRTSSVRRHFDTNHKSVAELGETERKEFLEGKLRKCHSQYLSFCNHLSKSNHLTAASFQISLCIVKHDKAKFEELDLSCLHWLDFGNLEMELLEFQESSIWKNKFFDLRATLEKIETLACEGMTKDRTVGSPENEILKVWNSLPNNFKSMKALGIAFLTLFGSSYACEQLFSALNYIKSDTRKQTDDVSAACVALKLTKYEPRFDKLSACIQQQRSH
ncbi:PREDICTED: uncharacterized protein LOC102022594 isoform X3 [Chinchilla lanigera]|uniref:uncharacterized protein LOC102022594 isoform X3 n=1 Tax=Chinchilla lanigera TaxID=34839 RepID=UPI000697B2FA|nr:PREDICTED: uncharacterized protein LOC102022594 isoform X3 [Chinchilla lanigera]